MIRFPQIPVCAAQGVPLASDAQATAVPLVFTYFEVFWTDWFFGIVRMAPPYWSDWPSQSFMKMFSS